MNKLILILFPFSIFGQYEIQKNHYPGQNSIAILAGLGETSFNYEIQYQHLLNNNNGLTIFSLYEKERNVLEFTSYNNFSLGGTYFYNIFRNSRGNIFYSHLHGGIYGGLENLKSKVTLEKDNKIIYGVRLGIDNEFYLINQFSLSLQFYQNYTVNSELGKYHWHILLGVKYNF